MYQAALADLDQILSLINGAEKVYIPAETAQGEANFTEYKPGLKLSTKLNTLRSAKDFFFPQIQPLAKFRREGKKIEIIDHRKESEDFVIFGARACDVRSFKVLDNVFLADPVDTNYQTRREHATVVTLACTRPAETCFCGSFDIDAAKPADGDARAWITGDSFYIEPLTEKGEKLVGYAKDVLKEGGEDKVEEQVEKTRTILAKLPLAELKPVDNREKELELFNSPKWAELSSHCLGCGACTFVCPTCQCFDINDFDSGHGIERYRCWDSCMYNDFTLMAAGTPRLTQKERFRQRFMHKLVYYPIKNDGMYSCVGCGRCLKKCPIQMNIVKVMKTLEEDA
ncbi:MAG: 4Fe-4S dicluster domain-containing protein [Lachnospiraceae bacterium]|nr:4Fe-4S dicluster domain-containing protein [Lachnospiraceae bacterium]